MQIAVCCPSAEEARWICRMIEDRGEEILCGTKTVSFLREADLWEAFSPGRFQGAVVGWGDVQGFLCARRLREEDSSCRVVLLDDTERYAIRSLRIHVADFLTRPLEEKRFLTAADRLLEN
jgi:DNA-binding response OmpR family regulator